MTACKIDVFQDKNKGIKTSCSLDNIVVSGDY